MSVARAPHATAAQPSTTGPLDCATLSTSLSTSLNTQESFMMDTLQSFTAPPFAKISSAKNFSPGMSRIDHAAAGFSEALAQLTELTTASAASVTRELSTLSPGKNLDAEDNADTPHPDAVVGVDIAALICLATPEPTLTPLCISNKASIDDSSIALLTTVNEDASVNASLPPIPITNAKTVVPGGQVKPLPEALVTISNEPLLETPIIAAPQVDITSRTSPLVQEDAAIGDGASQEAAGDRSESSTMSPRVKLQALSSIDTPPQVSEKNQSTHQLVEMVPIANLAAGNTAHAVVANGAIGPAATLLVPTHVESPAWSKDFGQHVIRLAVNGQPAAEIHLNPPELGPIRVSIEMNGRDATLQLSAEHLQTREALESALPRLREMFAASSTNLADANVTSQSPSSSQHAFGSPGRRFDQQGTPRGARALAVEDAAPESVSKVRPSADRSRVDLFA